MPFARALLAVTLALAFAQPAASAPFEEPEAPAMQHVAWSRNANIYEVNIRQYTKEGTFTAFATHLPRLKKMGVDILWIMPIHPIGVKNRKGSLGSYYAIRDYKGVNPEYGSLTDFKDLVRQAHGLGMRVIIDWVANHTAFDHPWVTAHKDWYKLDEKGEPFPVTYHDGAEPEYWTDVTALDYRNKALWQGMQDAMTYWVRETDIDGFRCDVAGLVPLAFWQETRVALDKIKPVFMLAEGEDPALHDRAFDMTYAWSVTNLLKDIAKGRSGARELARLVMAPPKAFPTHAYRMQFTNNHDFNSWQGSDADLYGPAFQAMAVLTATLPGMPLIYSGQESGLNKQLAFFEKDPIDFKDYPQAAFYAKLLKLKKDNVALWNGQYGGELTVLDAGNQAVFAFRRSAPGNQVTVAINLSDTAQKVTLPGAKLRLMQPWAWHIQTR